jgi:cold-inducible RNA-binding protein
MTKIYVGNISFDSTEDTVRQLFEQYGDVTNVYVPMDYVYDRNRGFAFVTMVGTTAAAQAIRETDGTDLDGQTIRVNVANDALVLEVDITKILQNKQMFGTSIFP